MSRYQVSDIRLNSRVMAWLTYSPRTPRHPLERRCPATHPRTSWTLEPRRISRLCCVMDRTSRYVGRADSGEAFTYRNSSTTSLFTTATSSWASCTPSAGTRSRRARTLKSSCLVSPLGARSARWPGCSCCAGKMAEVNHHEKKAQGKYSLEGALQLKTHAALQSLKERKP